jgi:hypothetical protein
MGDSEKVGRMQPGGIESKPVDQLNAKIGVLTRREVEARIVAPLVDALGKRFGHEEVLEVVRETIIRIAQEQGGQLVELVGGNSLAHFAESLKYWTQDNALEIEMIEQADEVFAFNVTRCRYAELYRALGVPELGAILSCNRDYALIEGFSPDVTLTRTQTLMSGGACCDFHYQRTKPV